MSDGSTLAPNSERERVVARLAEASAAALTIIVPLGPERRRMLRTWAYAWPAVLAVEMVAGVFVIS